MIVTQCHLCASKDLVKILDLGLHPLADFFPKEYQLASMEKRYPLYVVLCRSCGHAMNGFVVSGEERYQENDYSFESGNSKVATTHFAEMAESVATHAKLKKGDLVVDIGSNVGAFLLAFKERGMEIQGVDPAPNIAKIAEERGVPTVCDFFNESASTLIAKRGKVKAITAVNCFNHVAHLDEFMKCIVSLLHEDGVFVIESPHFLALLQKMQFDTVYHEHVSYLAVKPLAAFMKKYGLQVIHAEENEYLGGVIRIFVGKRAVDESVGAVIAKEEAAGLFDVATFTPYASRVFRCKLQLLKEIVEAKPNGGKIVAIGAAAKGNTLLNYCGVDSSLIDFATDVSPLKIGKYMPGSRIPIRGDDAIDEQVTHALILAWNLTDLLKRKIAPKHPHLKFITPHVLD